MKAAEEASFLLFVQEESPRLLHIAWLVTGDPHLAEELVQETLERLYVKWRRLRLEEVSAYARRVLINLKVDRWRRSRRESVTRTGELTETVDHRNHDDLVVQRHQLVSALRTLPARERACVVLRHYADLSERETADVLGVSVGTVKSSTSRGLARLRTAIPRGDFQ